MPFPGMSSGYLPGMTWAGGGQARPDTFMGIDLGHTSAPLMIQTQRDMQISQMQAKQRQSEIMAQLLPALLRAGIDARGMNLQEMAQKFQAALSGNQAGQNRAIAQRNLQMQNAQIPASASLDYLSSIVSPYYRQAMQMPTAQNKAKATSYF